MAEPAAGNDKSELKRLLKVASSHPVHMAMAIGPDGKPIMRMDKSKNAKALEKMIRAESPSAKDVRFGSVSVDPTETTEATFMLNKPLGGAARKLAVFLKPAGISKVHIVLEDGTAAESASDEETPAEAGGAAAGASIGAAMALSGAAGVPGTAGHVVRGHPTHGEHGHAAAHTAGTHTAGAHAAGAHPAEAPVDAAHHPAGPVAGQSGQAAKGKDGATGPNAIAALSDADFGKLIKAIEAELVHLHHPETGPIKAVPPAGAASKAAPAANGAQPAKAKPVVKLSDPDFAKLQELAKAGHFLLVPADAVVKAPEGKDATGKDATGKDATGKDATGKAPAHPGTTHPAPVGGSLAAGTAALGGAANPTPAHPDTATGGKDVAGKAPAQPGIAASTPNPAAGPAPDGKAPDGGGMTAAKLTKDLTGLVKQVMTVVKQDPSQQAELSRLAIDAQVSIRANDLEGAMATMQVLEQALDIAIQDIAAQDVAALDDHHTKLHGEWTALRAQIDADLENHRAAALKAGIDPKQVEEAHAAAKAAIDPALAAVSKDVADLKQAKIDADRASIKQSAKTGLDKVADHLGNDKLFNLIDVFLPFKPAKTLSNIAAFASKLFKGFGKH